MTKKTKLPSALKTLQESPEHLACLEEILQKYEQWDMWKALEDDVQGDKTTLIIHGMIRFTIENHQFKIEGRDPQTGEWGPSPVFHLGLLAEVILTGRGGSPAANGRKNALNIVETLVDVIHDQHFNRPKRVQRANYWATAQDIENENQWSQAVEIYTIRKNALRQVMRKRILTQSHERLTASWLTLAKHIWKNLDREVLNGLLLSQYMTSVVFGQYQAIAPYAQEIKSIKAVSKSLMPWLHQQPKENWASIAEKIQANERVLTEWTSVEEGGFNFSSSSFSTTTKQYQQVDWQDVKDVPFVVAHACMMMDVSKRALFLKSWKDQPQTIKDQSLWLMPALANGYFASYGWDFRYINNDHLQPLMNIVLSMAAQEKAEKGYRTVVKKEWRSEFLGSLSNLAEAWAHNPTLAPPNRNLTEDEMLAALPPSSMKAGLQKKQLLNSGSQPSLASPSIRRRL